MNNSKDIEQPTQVSHRASVAKWVQANRPKRLAHRRVEYAIISGKLIRQPCEVCGSEKSQGHHDDYSAPLDVRWFCAKHHKQHHKSIKDVGLFLAEVDAGLHNSIKH